MFKGPGQFEQGASVGGRSAGNIRAQILGGAPTQAATVTRQAAQNHAPLVGGLRHHIETWCANLDLAPDLTKDIGSKRWLRGFATIVGLSALAMAFWPDFSQVEAADLHKQASVSEEHRSRIIAPLASDVATDLATGSRKGATAQIRMLTGVPERPDLRFTATLGQGDTLAGMLGRAGLGGADIASVGSLVRTAVPMGHIAPGTRFDITLGGRPAPGAARALQAIDFRVRFDLGLRIVRHGSELALVRHPVAVDSTPLRIRGEVGSSLYRSARNAGAPIAAIQNFLRAIDPHISLESDLAASDAFDIVIAYKRSATGERQLGDLLYAGLERDGKPRLQLLRWGQDGAMVAAGSFNSVVASQPRSMGAPVAGPITSRFGMRRHPILGFVRMHSGVDFGARYGTPIFAVADGRASYAGRHGGHGNYVRIEHGGGHATGYSHMSRIAVSPGSLVRAGQVLGYVGSSGLSTGPHLHFEAYQDGRKVNPMGLRFAAARPPVDNRELGAFQQRLASILAIRPGAALAPLTGASRAVASQDNSAREINRIAETGAARQTQGHAIRHALASVVDLPASDWRNHN